MKKSRFTESQIVSILKKADTGRKVAEICCKHGISEATYYHWKSRHGGLSISELKRMYANLALENQAMKDRRNSRLYRRIRDAAINALWKTYRKDENSLDFKSLDLREAKLKNAKLNGADLKGAFLTKADLSDADLIGANLFSTELDSVSLCNAKLISAFLFKVNLRDANLMGASLRDAYLNGANLSGANLSNADFEKAKGLDELKSFKETWAFREMEPEGFLTIS